ncbi:hypothetical protein Tco_0144368 [Tanacetum coccineum]
MASNEETNAAGGKICFDEYETAFIAIGTISIHVYFVRFHKLVNDMKITQLQYSNSSDETPIHITHRKAYEPHANNDSQKQEQSSGIVDPLGYSFPKEVSTTNNQLRSYSTHGSCYGAMMVTLSTEPVQRKAPGNVGNTGARGKKVICYNCRGEGHVARQSEAFLDDVECTAPYDQPQALIQQTCSAIHEDAMTQTVDEAQYSGDAPGRSFLTLMLRHEIDDNTIAEGLSGDQAFAFLPTIIASQASIIKERTTQKPDYVSEWCYDYAKQFVEQQLVPFYDHFKKHIQAANDTFFKEIREFEQIFDDLERIVGHNVFLISRTRP